MGELLLAHSKCLSLNPESLPESSLNLGGGIGHTSRVPVWHPTKLTTVVGISLTPKLWMAALIALSGTLRYMKNMLRYTIGLVGLLSLHRMQAQNVPVFTTQPISASVSGRGAYLFDGTVVFTAQANNSQSYQWLLNGQPIVTPPFTVSQYHGITSPILVVSTVQTAAMQSGPQFSPPLGTYTCVATNSAGSMTSNPAVLSLNDTSDVGRLINLSCRAQVGTGADNGYEQEAVFVETMSGGRAANRPELLKAISLTCKVHGVLVVFSLSRLARSVKDTLAIAERLEKAGANLASLTERIDTNSALGKMVFRLLSTLNEFEKDQLSERTESAMGHMRRTNRRISARIPLGYPPRKSNDESMGDAFNWEWIVTCMARKGLDVVIVTRDSDYGYKVGEAFHLNDCLALEVRERAKNLKVTVVDLLTKGLELIDVDVTPKEIKQEEQTLTKPLSPEGIQLFKDMYSTPFKASEIDVERWKSAFGSISGLSVLSTNFGSSTGFGSGSFGGKPLGG